ncbi:MAG TPA: Calx-beta domain-containing protein [Actinomycetota bacterium]|nr:Calx-beta domain-containing protein [Actinomycetota bacterium]
MSASAVVVRARVFRLIALVGLLFAVLPVGAAHAALRPSARINDTTVTEGNNGTISAVFTVSLNQRPVTPFTVDYATSDGTATAGDDYGARSGSITFLTGDVSEQVTVPVFGDTLPEVDETFKVTLSNPRGGTIARKVGTATILDDEGIPADLALTLVAPPTGVSGTPFTYLITVANNGPGDAYDVVVADPIPAEMSVQNLTPRCVQNANDVVVCDVGTIGSADSAVITIEVVPNISGTFDDFAGAFQSSPDPNPHNNFDSATTIVTQP